MDKRNYYTNPQVVQQYEHTRFGGVGGAYVNTRECNIVMSMLPKTGTILDLPCGTGRVSKVLREHSFQVIAADFSPLMLKAYQQRYTEGLIVRADAFRLPFFHSTFDAVVSLRFVFHYSQLVFYFHEVAHVLKPGGVFIFDTYTWSPFMFRSTPMIVGGRSFIHSLEDIQAAARLTGFIIQKRMGAFICSPLVYRFLPGCVINLLDIIEKKLTVSRCNVNFWQLQRI